MSLLNSQTTLYFYQIGIWRSPNTLDQDFYLANGDVAKVNQQFFARYDAREKCLIDHQSNQN